MVMKTPGPIVGQVEATASVARSAPAPGAVGSSSFPAWRLGQILQAVVLARTSPASAVLGIDGAKVSVRTELALVPGQTLRLRVEGLGKTAMLRLTAPGQPMPLDVRAIALKSALPQQVPLAQILRSVAVLTQPGQAAAVPAPVVRAAHQLLGPVPSLAATISPAGLRQAVQDSGVFLEAKLAAAALRSIPVSFATDLKARLLRFVSALRSDAGAPPGSTAARSTPSAPPALSSHARPGTTGSPTSARPGGDSAKAADPTPPSTTKVFEPGRMIAEAEGALARIQVHQLGAVKVADAPVAVWRMELPMMVARELQTIHVRIERDASAAEEPADPAWAVDVRVNLGARGDLAARVSYVGGVISTALWAEESTTAELIAGRLDELRRDLADAGLSVGSVHCWPGRPPPPEEDRIGAALLEVRA